MKTIKKYLNKFIPFIFCLLAIGYTQCGYADSNIKVSINIVNNNIISIKGLATEIKRERKIINQEILDGLRTALANHGATTKILFVHNLALNPDTLKQILLLIQGYSQLITIEFSRNAIDNNGAGVIATFLQTNNTLRTIHIEFNEIADAGAQAIIEALGENQHRQPTTLEFINNNISEEGEQTIIDYIRENQLPISISLEDNHSLIADDTTATPTSTSTSSSQSSRTPPLPRLNLALVIPAASPIPIQRGESRNNNDGMIAPPSSPTNNATAAMSSPTTILLIANNIPVPIPQPGVNTYSVY